MERNEELFEEIEAYLRGEMSPADSAAFAARIADDSALAAEVSAQQMELEAMEVLLEDKLRDDMSSWASDPPVSPPKKPSGGSWIWLLLVGGLAVAAFLLWPGDDVEQPSAISDEAPAVPAPVPAPPPTAPPTPPDPAPQRQDAPIPSPPPEQEKKEAPVFAQEEPTVSPPDNSRLLAMATTAYRQPDELTLKSAGDDTSSPLDAGLEAYGAEDFAMAITEFSTITSADGEAYYERARELLGHAYFRAGRYAEAAEVFATFAADTEFRSVRAYGEWYLLLSLLPDYNEQKKRVDALVAKVLGEAGHEYRAEAEKISRSLSQDF